MERNREVIRRGGIITVNFTQDSLYHHLYMKLYQDSWVEIIDLTLRQFLDWRPSQFCELSSRIQDLSYSKYFLYQACNIAICPGLLCSSEIVAYMYQVHECFY